MSGFCGYGHSVGIPTGFSVDMELEWVWGEIEIQSPRQPCYNRLHKNDDVFSSFITISGRDRRTDRRAFCDSTEDSAIDVLLETGTLITGVDSWSRPSQTTEEMRRMYM